MQSTVKVAIGAAAIVAMSGAPARAANCPGADTTVTASSQSQARSATACLINERRASAGVPALTADGDLASSAGGHAADMVARHFFDHVNPDGKAVLDRIKDSGFLDGATRYETGEDLGEGSGSASTPRRIVALWMGSAPHRANILDARFRYLGVGVALGMPTGGEPGATYAVDFGDRTTSTSGAAPRAAADDGSAGDGSAGTSSSAPSATTGSAPAPKPVVRKVKRCTRKIVRHGRRRTVIRRCTVRTVRAKRTTRS